MSVDSGEEKKPERVMLAAPAYLTALRSMWAKKLNPGGYAVSWHLYNRHEIQKLQALAANLLQLQRATDTPHYCCGTLPGAQVNAKALLQATIDELLFVARSELCPQRSDKGSSVAVDYTVSVDAYSALLAVLPPDEEPKWDKITEEAKNNRDLIRSYFLEQPGAQDALQEEAQRLYNFIRSRYYQEDNKTTEAIAE